MGFSLLACLCGPYNFLTGLLQLPPSVIDRVQEIESAFNQGFPNCLPGLELKIPRLSVYTGQVARIESGMVVYRECFEVLIQRVAREWEDPRKLYVFGPKGETFHVVSFGRLMCVGLIWAHDLGEGKSHALLYLAAVLWARYIAWKRSATETSTDSTTAPSPPPLRVLYIPEWNAISELELLQELQLTYYDDPEMLAKIDNVIVQGVSSGGILRLFLGKPHQLVVILDQAFDTNASNRKDFSDYFPGGSAGVKIIFASSPRFERQSEFLGNDQAKVVPHPFMQPLTMDEFRGLTGALYRTALLKQQDSPDPLAGGDVPNVQGALMVCMLFSSVQCPNWVAA